MSEMKVKTLVLTAMFGSLAVMLSFIYISLPPFGDVTPASTPISVISVIAPSSVGVMASFIKGIGVSMWTGDWFMEIPVGAGDAIMAAFTHYLTTKKKVKHTYGVIAGQLSRYLFTSGMVALYISTVLSLGIPSPLGGDVVAKFNQYAKRIGLTPADQPFLACMVIVWLARFPSMTLSILLNVILSAFIIASGEKQLRIFIRHFTEKTSS